MLIPSSLHSISRRTALADARSSKRGTRVTLESFVSGDVIIVTPPGSVAHRGIARLGELGPQLPDFALIGGLSVIIRLGQAHRPDAVLR